MQVIEKEGVVERDHSFYENEVIRYLYRSKLKSELHVVRKLFYYYSGIERYVDTNYLPQYCLYLAMQGGKEISHSLVFNTFISMKTLCVRAATNNFSWRSHEVPFLSFLRTAEENKERVNVWYSKKPLVEGHTLYRNMLML